MDFETRLLHLSEHFLLRRLSKCFQDLLNYTLNPPVCHLHSPQRKGNKCFNEENSNQVGANRSCHSRNWGKNWTP